MDLNKFKLPESNGIFENGEDYQKWSSWAKTIRDDMSSIIYENQFKSSPPTDKQYENVSVQCNINVESAIHVIIHDMSQNGGSWVHLGLLRRLVEENVVPDHHRGRFLLQLSDWYIWYCKKLDIEV